MLKGVNKQVLEINETQNSFFEKAIFFVKPEYSGMSEGKLRESAKREMETAGTPPHQKSFYRLKLKGAIIVAGFFIAGLFIGLAGGNFF